jgi:serine/threonine protein kinase
MIAATSASHASKGPAPVESGPPNAQDATTAHLRPATEQAIDLDRFPFLLPEGPEELGWLAHYRVLSLIGEGGMGFVFLAEDPRLQRKVALKVMRPTMAQDETARQRFLREARATASLRSDNIVTIYEIGQAEDVPYIAAELLHGRPLDAWLKEGNRPAPAQVLDFGIQIAHGLDTAHRSGLVHRDIKPANLWLEEPLDRIKILDFGLVRDAKGSRGLTVMGQMLGTVGYMAPEQAEGLVVDERSDMFSLGCVLYELACGERPFLGKTTTAVLKAVVQQDPIPVATRNTELPVEFSNLVTQMLAKKPADRPASVAEIARRLEESKAALHGRGRASIDSYRGLIAVVILGIVSALALGAMVLCSN